MPTAEEQIISQEGDIEIQETMGQKILSFIKKVLIYLVSACLIIAALLFTIDKTPGKSLFGYRYYNVLTSSMRPELSVGDMIFVKVSGVDEIKLNDVITFTPSETTYLTHRVIKIKKIKGKKCFITKGDANSTKDILPVTKDNLVGKVAFCIPMAGYVIAFIQLRWYIIVPMIILCFVFLELLSYYLNPEHDLKGEDEEEEKIEEVAEDAKAN